MTTSLVGSVSQISNVLRCMPTFGQSDKQKLNALFREARELREQSKRLQVNAESLRKFVDEDEQTKPEPAAHPKKKK